MRQRVYTLAEPPPSTNNLFANRRARGRVKTAAYEAWQRSAGWELKAQYAARISGPVMVDLTVRRTSGLSDIDNRIKAILDLLVAMQLIDDDRNVAEVRARWAKPCDPVVGCTIVIVPALPAAMSPEELATLIPVTNELLDMASALPGGAP